MDASPGLFVLAAVAAALVAASGGGAEPLRLDFHHRFSAAVRGWAEAAGHPGHCAPPAGTAEYFAALAAHDLRRRSLAAGLGAGEELAFADGNATFRLSSLGFLHYSIVALGTPNVTFLVALDTGSDLLWVPCDCVRCAPLTSPNYGSLKFDVYSPQNSSTSRKVLCNSSLCAQQTSCPGATSSCPYTIPYLSDNTSSSGVLVEDVLYLTTESAQPKIVHAPITFGCGQTQTGTFLGNAAPNGLLGLAMGRLSIPSLLASKDLGSNSFSMCFGKDGLGRINFGDKGSSDQQETPFNIDKQNPLYNISITSVTVGNSSIDAAFSAIVDSGTSFTTLGDPMYTQIASSFDAQVQDSRNLFGSSLPFDYCYSLSTSETTNYPNVSLTANGGSIFPVSVPVFVFSDIASNPIGYCLAIVKSNGVNIIGENFMTGLRIVFDRERLVLGWKNFDCYSVDNSSTLPVNNPSAVPPKPSLGPSGYTPEATKGGPNDTQITVLQPSSSFSLRLCSDRNTFLVAALLLAIIF